MQKFASMDIPDSVIRAYVDIGEHKSVAVALKNILLDALPKYFDRFGNFKGIFVNFAFPVYLSDGKQRANTFTRYSVAIDDETWNMLSTAQTYTTISKKNIAEIVVLKEILEGGEKDATKDSPVHNQ